jgi:hypothetical protein
MMLKPPMAQTTVEQNNFALSIFSPGIFSPNIFFYEERFH